MLACPRRIPGQRDHKTHFEVAVAMKEMASSSKPTTRSHIQSQLNVWYEERQGVQYATDERGEARDRTPQERAPAPGERSIVRKPLREAHADRSPNRGRQPDQKRDPRIPRRKSRRKQRRQRRHRSIHQAEGSGLDVLENKGSIRTPQKTCCLQHHPGDQLSITMLRAILHFLSSLGTSTCRSRPTTRSACRACRRSE